MNSENRPAVCPKLAPPRPYPILHPLAQYFRMATQHAHELGAQPAVCVAREDGHHIDLAPLLLRALHQHIPLLTRRASETRSINYEVVQFRIALIGYTQFQAIGQAG